MKELPYVGVDGLGNARCIGKAGLRYNTGMDENADSGLNRGTFSRKGWVGAILFVSLFLLIGLGTLTGGVLIARKSGESLKWPQANGEIVVSRVINAYTTGSTQMYAVDVEYRYAIQDHVYTAKKIKDGDYSSSDWKEMQRIAGRYLPRQPVTVYYDPTNPENALLEPGYGSTAWIPFLIGGVFTLVGAGLGLSLVWVYSRLPAPISPKRGARKERRNADF